jgi:hypothetical protein
MFKKGNIGFKEIVILILILVFFGVVVLIVRGILDGIFK